jgi:hypothetical protein
MKYLSGIRHLKHGDSANFEVIPNTNAVEIAEVKIVNKNA